MVPSILLSIKQEYVEKILSGDNRRQHKLEQANAEKK